MSRNDVTVRIDGHFENFTAILLSWMLSDPHFPFRRSLLFLIFSILTKNRKYLYVRSYKYFAFSALVHGSFLRMWMGKTNMYSLSRPILPQGTTSAAKVYLTDLVALNLIRLPDLNFTNVASFIADS